MTVPKVKLLRTSVKAAIERLLVELAALEALAVAALPFHLGVRLPLVWCVVVQTLFHK